MVPSGEISGEVRSGLPKRTFLGISGAEDWAKAAAHRQKQRTKTDRERDTRMKISPTVRIVREWRYGASRRSVPRIGKLTGGSLKVRRDTPLFRSWMSSCTGLASPVFSLRIETYV